MTAKAKNTKIDSTHPTWMELNTAALRQNVAKIRNRISHNVQIIASVKANAYGHSILPVAHILENEGVEMLATGSFLDAVNIRKAGVLTPILMLAGTLPGGINEILNRGFIPTLYNIEGLYAAVKAAENLPNSCPIPVFVKVDCGMGRLGVSLEDVPVYLEKIDKFGKIWVQGIYTHLSFKNETGMSYTKERFNLFYDLLKNLKDKGRDIPITQALASSSLMMGWIDDCSAICPGHLLYGMPSVGEELALASDFLPVLAAIKSRVIQVTIHKEDPELKVGGYHLHRRERRTAVVPCGLNDGNRPSKPGIRSEIMFKGRRLAVLGCSLEHLVFEVPDDVEIIVGDTVVIVGGEGEERIDISEFAAWQGVSSLECMMSLSSKMPVVAI